MKCLRLLFNKKKIPVSQSISLFVCFFTKNNKVSDINVERGNEQELKENTLKSEQKAPGI